MCNIFPNYLFGELNTRLNNTFAIEIVWHGYCYMLYTMKQNTNKYENVDILPLDAISVKQYALNINCTVSNIYMRIKRNNADFKIITFQSYNFVIPL